MKINIEKTKVVTVVKERKNDIEINGKAIEQVEDFQYLGSTLQADEWQDIEISV